MRLLQARLALRGVERSLHDPPANLRAQWSARRAVDAGHRRGDRRVFREVAIADPEPFRPDRRGVAALHAVSVDHAIALVELRQRDAFAFHGYGACERIQRSVKFRRTKGMRESIAHEAGVEPSSEDLEHHWMTQPALSQPVCAPTMAPVLGFWRNTTTWLASLGSEASETFHSPAALEDWPILRM